MYELFLNKKCRGFVLRGIIFSCLGVAIAVVVGKQSTTIADEIGHVLADLLSINLRG